MIFQATVHSEEGFLVSAATTADKNKRNNSWLELHSFTQSLQRSCCPAITCKRNFEHHQKWSMARIQSNKKKERRSSIKLHPFYNHLTFLTCRDQFFIVTLTQHNMYQLTHFQFSATKTKYASLESISKCGFSGPKRLSWKILLELDFWNCGA